MKSKLIKTLQLKIITPNSTITKKKNSTITKKKKSKKKKQKTKL